MKRKLNKWLSGVLAACVLFTTVPVYAINDVSGTETSTEVVETSEETQSSEIETSSTEETNQESSESTESSETTSEQTSEIADEMLNISPMNLGDEDEPSTDNWELGLVFYDSTVDNGKTPLTSIDWDASDGSYKEGTPRVITVQINYKNTNAVTTYQPGDLSISIDSLLKGADVSIYSANGISLMHKIVVGANDSTHTGYDWNYTSKLDSENEYQYGKKEKGSFIFTNANIIEEKSNFEGSIQIVYTITPRENYGYNMTTMTTNYNDEHTYSFSNTLKAVLNNTVESNEANFNYTRTYIHPWQYRKYTIDKTASKISSLDGLPEGDYYWVKYVFKLNGYCDSDYPYIGTNNHNIIDTFPSECIVLDESLSKLTAENNTYTIPAGRWSYSSKSLSIYVGYPKSIYNDENGNLNITNHADLYSQYKDSEEYIFSDDDDVSLNLSNFNFTYSGDLYGISKSFINSTNYAYSSSYPMYYESLIGKDINVGNGGKPLSRLSPKAIYTGNAMDIKFGDDLLYITGSDGNYRKLNDDEYYFSTIQFPTTLRNGNGITISNGKYDCELWVRYAGNKNFTLYEEFKNGYGAWTFEKNDNVVGYYFIIKEMTESLNCYYEYTSVGCSTIVINNATDIAESGRIYNFAFIQVYIDGVLQNEPDLNSYANFITKDEIAAYDQNTYRLYMQRATDYVIYKKYEITKPIYEMYAHKSMSSFTQDSTNEVFNGKATIRFYFQGHSENPTLHEIENYSQNLGKDYQIEGFEIYDLLPEGMRLTSTAEEIIDSFNISIYSPYGFVCNSKGKKLSLSTYKKLLKDNAQIEIIENWNNTNRTYLHVTINLEDEPLFIIANITYNEILPLTLSYNYEVPYDSFLEYGNVWTNRAYFEYHNKEKNNIFTYDSYHDITDDGQLDMQESDINQNGNTTETLVYYSDSSTITSVVSTHQDVQTQVQTANDNFTVGKGTSPYGDEYTYKLRARTGQNAATNMVIANNLEMAFNNKKHWQGEFLGVDTSYIENKTFYVYDPSNPNADDEENVAEKVKVKVYYSENPEETNLYLTEMTQVIEDGNEVSKEVFITDGDGNILKNTNWKEFTDDVDKSSVKSLAFELLNAETGEPAVIPANSLVYVLVTMKAPEDPYLNEDVNEEDRPLANDIKTFAYNNCWTQWTAIDSFGQEVDFVTGINSNIVKVALPYSVDTDEFPTVTLKFIKEISGTDSDFENMLLDKAEERNFKITLTSLTANENGSYNQITGLLSSTQGLTLSKVPIGTYLITESDDIYFDFVEMIPNNDEELIIDGVVLEKTDKGYVLTISDDLSGDVEFNIKVTNKIEPDRPYEDKEEKENLFKI